MKCEEALEFLSQIRKTLPGIENFLQNTLVKEHLSAQGRNELHSILHILSHIQLAALPSLGKNSKSSVSNLSSSSRVSSTIESENTHSISTTFGTDTEFSPSFESSPFSSPTRLSVINPAPGRAKRTEIKTEFSRIVDCNKSADRQPIPVSRSGRPLKVATGRLLPGECHVARVDTSKRKRRVTSTTSPPQSKKSKTHKLYTNTTNTSPTTTFQNNKPHKGKHITSIQKSIVPWTQSKKTNKRTTAIAKNEEENIKNSICN
ncbi:hypothetical protein LOD99_15288 [Oopsacas minuta]|uniref:Uncharacterized protein n=1 Tax=Oopsacas minuta TaxID=111878 RepID=A0AAV7KBC1_9METZ|nr:hypothetical protein LOD99_15288 [Oopsacas minuta]